MDDIRGKGRREGERGDRKEGGHCMERSSGRKKSQWRGGMKGMLEGERKRSITLWRNGDKLIQTAERQL